MRGVVVHYGPLIRASHGRVTHTSSDNSPTITLLALRMQYAKWLSPFFPASSLFIVFISSGAGLFLGGHSICAPVLISQM